MLASRFEAASLPTIMADDTMEISSEHGHNVGDEDIDIDIDFTAGPVDEDYVLEDAASNVGFGEDFHPQPSPAIGHDDLMFDEEEESFPMPVDGEDFMQDENRQKVEYEALDVSFTPVPIGNATVQVDGKASGEISNVVPDGEMKESEFSWETNEEPQQESYEAGVPVVPEETRQDVHGAEGDPEEFQVQRRQSHQEYEEVRDSKFAKDSEALPASTHLEDSLSSKSYNASPRGSEVEEEPRSLTTGISAPDLGSSDREPEHSDETHGFSTIPQDTVNTIGSASAEESATVPPSQEAVVVYRDSEYSLFSKSDSDDVDSYFLSDLSIKDKPLVKFFEAIRDVIRDDLTDEEELCLAIEDLGLEVEEISASLTGDITIGQIIHLHEKLLQNDGGDSIRPTCLSLSTRPNLSARFANLISGVSEGKGLSELLQWEEHSELLDESAQVTDNEHGKELDAGSYDVDELAETLENEVPQQEVSDDTLAREPAAEHKPLEEATTVQSDDASRTAATNGIHAFDNSITQPTNTEGILPSQNIEASGSGEYDEDGDLIDYSDVEDDARLEVRKDAKPRPSRLATDDVRAYNGTFTDFIPPCLKPNTCFCSKCNDLLLAEYESINEELRRRSISRTADNLLEQATQINERENIDEETNLETENGTEYDENDREQMEPNNFTAEHEYQPIDFNEDGSVEFGIHEDELFIEDGDADGDEFLEGHDHTSEATAIVGLENFDEFDFGANDDTEQQHRLPELDGEEVTSNDDHNDSASNDNTTAALIKETSTGSNLSFADAAVSESAASEKTLEAQPVSNDAFHTKTIDKNDDEIDYDDDEELDAPEVKEPVVKEPAVKELQPPSSGSGKRQRTEDDGTSTGSKEDAKRPRS